MFLSDKRYLLFVLLMIAVAASGVQRDARRHANPGSAHLRMPDGDATSDRHTTAHIGAAAHSFSTFRMGHLYACSGVHLDWLRLCYQHTLPRWCLHDARLQRSRRDVVTTPNDHPIPDTHAVRHASASGVLRR